MPSLGHIQFAAHHKSYTNIADLLQYYPCDTDWIIIYAKVIVYVFPLHLLDGIPKSVTKHYWHQNKRLQSICATVICATAFSATIIFANDYLLGCTTFGCYGSAGGRERAGQGGVTIRG